MTYSGIRKATEVFTNISVTGGNSGIRAGTDILVDAGGKGDYTTVAAALAAVTPGSGHITINPGVYVENNPLTVPDGVYVEGKGYATAIVAQNAGEHLFIAGASVVFHNLYFAGSTGVGKALVYYAGGSAYNFTIVRNCLIGNCYYGFLSETGPGELVCREVGGVTTATENIITGFVAQNGGLMRCYIAAIQGNPAQRPVVGYYVSGASKMELGLCDAVNCVTGVNNNNGGDLNMINVEMRDCDSSILLNGASTTSDTRMFSVRAINSTTWDINIQITDSTVLSGIGCDFLAEKINNPNSVEKVLSFASNKPGDRAQIIQGELHVGSYNSPAESVFGGGDSHVIGLSVLTNTNGEAGTWANITSSFIDTGDSTAILPALTVGAAVYVGGDLEFHGVKVLTSVASVWGAGTIILEYWNGSAWTALPCMITKADPNYFSYNAEVFQRAQSEQVRFGATTSWATKNLNGVTKYWIRWSVATASITSNATVSQIKLHTCRTEINADGFIEFFGNGRQIKQLPWDQNITAAFGNSPANQDLFYGDNLAVGRVENNFEAGVYDLMGLNAYLPLDIDTSYPAKFSLIYKVSAAGDYMYEVRWGRTSPNDALHDNRTAAPATGATEQVSAGTITLGAPDIGLQKKLSVNMDIADFNARREDGTVDLLWVSFGRLGNNVGDTGGIFTIAQITVYYISWCNGGHISSYSLL